MNTNNTEKTSADLVVYGKIFTSENGQIVEAFAVKDGKYVYVGAAKKVSILRNHLLQQHQG